MLETHTIFDDESAGLQKAPVGHRITDIKESVKDKNRVNVYVDDKFFCSLDISQIIDLKIKIGKAVSEEQLDEYKRASDFGKFYARALAFVLMRPHSAKEVRDYLNRKTIERTVRVKNPKTGEYVTKKRSGFDQSLVRLVFERLESRGYIDDETFARAWVENRHVAKGISRQKLRLELQQKGVAAAVIDNVLAEDARDDRAELRKIIERKSRHYNDRQKLIQYLLRQGFNYSDVVDELSETDSSSV